LGTNLFGRAPEVASFVRPFHLNFKDIQEKQLPESEVRLASGCVGDLSSAQLVEIEMKLWWARAISDGILSPLGLPGQHSGPSTQAGKDCRWQFKKSQRDSTCPWPEAQSKGFMRVRRCRALP
jgi:hypothetical protein